MIAFELTCNNGHIFEGWFESGQDYEDQLGRGLVTCPVCNDPSIKKVLSPVRSVGQRPGEGGESLKTLVKAVNDYVHRNFEDVGTDFAKEALKIHYGATPQRNIMGVSTAAEEEQLREEGVAFAKVPLMRPAN